MNHRFADVHTRRQVRVVNHSVDVDRSFADTRGRHWYHGWHNGRYGWWLAGPGLAWTYYTYPWWGYGYSQPYASQTWYYCSDPVGYYPYVTQCGTGWQTVPAS